MSTQIPKKRAILFILITLNVHEIQTQKFSYRLCLPCLLPWGTYLLPPTFSENSCRCAPGSFPKNLRSKGIPLSPLTKTRLKDFDVSRGKEMTLLIRNFAFLAPWFIIILPASQRRIRDLGKMHFSRIPHFPSAVFTSGENPQEFSRNKNAGKMIYRTGIELRF